MYEILINPILNLPVISFPLLRDNNNIQIKRNIISIN